MNLPKTCPRCAKQISQKELRSFSSRIDSRKTAPCPHCGTRLRWHRHDWWLLHAGALVILGGVLGLIATLVKWVAKDNASGFTVVILAGAAITLFATVRLRLVALQPPDDDG